jgi:RNA methyltransferase, TrmH family
MAVVQKGGEAGVLPATTMTPLPKARLKQLRALKTRKARLEQRLFVAEGPTLLQEALRAGARPAYIVTCPGQGDAERLHELAAACAARGAQIFHAEPEDFRQAADTVHSQGALGVFDMPHTNPAALFARPTLTLLVLDNVRDPGNLGTIVRQGAAFACDGVLLLKGCVDAFNHKAIRASMGGIFHVPVLDELTPEQVMESLASAGVWPYVTGTKGRDVFAIHFPPRTAFIIGGEAEGVQPFWGERDVIEVSIPQSDKVESLNAAVAAGIILAYRYHATLPRA